MCVGEGRGGYISIIAIENSYALSFQQAICVCYAESFVRITVSNLSTVVDAMKWNPTVNTEFVLRYMTQYVELMEKHIVSTSTVRK